MNIQVYTTADPQNRTKSNIATLCRFEIGNVERPGSKITAAERLLHVSKIMAAVNLSAEKTFGTN